MPGRVGSVGNYTRRDGGTWQLSALTEEREEQREGRIVNVCTYMLNIYVYKGINT